MNEPTTKTIVKPKRWYGLLMVVLAVFLVGPNKDAPQYANHDGYTYINAGIAKGDDCTSKRTPEAPDGPEQTQQTWGNATDCQKTKVQNLEALSDANLENVYALMSELRNCYCNNELRETLTVLKLGGGIALPIQKCTVDCGAKCECTAWAAASPPNKKENGNIVMKANRPGIISSKPWHDIEHIRDALRFKTVMANLEDVPKLVAIVRDAKGADGKNIVKHILKIDVDKLFAPKTDHLHPDRSWGWRIIAFDLLMQNGQVVEWYLPVSELEMQKKHGGAARTTRVDASNKSIVGGGHLLFEAFRNMSEEQQRTQKVPIKIESHCPEGSPEVGTFAWTLPFALAMLKHGCDGCPPGVATRAGAEAQEFFKLNGAILTNPGDEKCKIDLDFGELNYLETLSLSSALYNHAFTLGLIRMGYGHAAPEGRKDAYVWTAEARNAASEKVQKLVGEEVLADFAVDQREFQKLKNMGESAQKMAQQDWDEIKEDIKKEAQLSSDGKLKTFDQDKGTECNPATCGGDEVK